MNANIFEQLYARRVYKVFRRQFPLRGRACAFRFFATVWYNYRYEIDPGRGTDGPYPRWDYVLSLS